MFVYRLLIYLKHIPSESNAIFSLTQDIKKVVREAAAPPF